MDGWTKVFLILVLGSGAIVAIIYAFAILMETLYRDGSWYPDDPLKTLAFAAIAICIWMIVKAKLEHRE